MSTTYDVIVFGAGIEGSACAYGLAKKGQRVLLLDQFPLPHSRGSSHGQSRITRYAYMQDFYVHMMLDAFPMWKRLEEESGEDLFINCGVLDMGIENSPSMQRLISNLRKYNVPLEVLSPKELQRRYPVVNFGQGVGAVFDPSGGILRSDRALVAFQRVFKQMGGTIRDGEPVVEVHPGHVVIVKTTGGVYNAHNLVMSAGAWSPRWTSLLDIDAPMRPIKVAVTYWKIQEGKEIEHSAKNLPCLIDRSGIDTPGSNPSNHIYGLFASEYPGLVKICMHYGPNVNPDEREKTDTKVDQESVGQTIGRKFLYLETTPSIVETCMYTITPDGHPYIDRHPKYPNIIISAGFSGHGFKLAPAVGNAVSQLILGTSPSYNMAPFKLDRFKSKAHL